MPNRKRPNVADEKSKPLTDEQAEHQVELMMANGALHSFNRLMDWLSKGMKSPHEFKTNCIQAILMLALVRAWEEDPELGRSLAVEARDRFTRIADAKDATDIVEGARRGAMEWELLHNMEPTAAKH